MNKKRIIDEFIRLRAEEVTYDKLVEHLGYSKPTLIAWGKKYANEIKMKKQTDLMCQFGNDILMKGGTDVRNQRSEVIVNGKKNLLRMIPDC